MSIKYQIEHSLDSPERTEYHGELILKKTYLKKLYEQWYAEFSAEIKTLPPGKLVELGSGAGFFKSIEPSVITSDILDLAVNDMTFSALDMPFEEASLAGLFMIDTMHHIPDNERFLQEVSRVLVSGGKMVLIEPANSVWGRFIYQNFHHEPFDPEGGWTIPSTGPLSGANGALPWIVFERDRLLFEEKFPNLKVTKIQYRNPLLYLLSGGVSYRQLLPDFMYGLLNWLDSTVPKLSKQVSMFQLIVVEKTD